jgi:hypothetical protein
MSRGPTGGRKKITLGREALLRCETGGFTREGVGFAEDGDATARPFRLKRSLPTGLCAAVLPGTTANRTFFWLILAP